MTQKEKAIELVNYFKDFVHGYVGSSMLSNYEYPEQILKQAKNCAKKVVNEIIESSPTKPIECELYSDSVYESTEWWMGVLVELEKLKQKP